MQNDKLASQTALTAAAARAAHLLVDAEPHIFADGLAGALLGSQAGELIAYHQSHGGHPVLSGARAQVVCRSRYTEDRLAAAIGRGVAQYVILGAGLDSFGYRSRLAASLAVFEVDHPASQEWKRGQLSAAGITVPPGVTFVPADFESGSLAAALRAAGFDPDRPALVSWLGVTMYLTREAIGQAVAEIGRFAPGTELIADYMLPAGLRDAAGDDYASQVMAVAAERGEPWLSFFAPDDMSALLASHGFGVAGQLSQWDAIPAGLWERSDALRPSLLSMLAHGTVRPR